MKPTDFYEGTVQSNGTELTDSIVNIADPEVDYMDAYYMGYVSYYLLPENLKFHQIQLDNGSLLINDQTDRNHAWGFCNVEQYYGLSYSDVVYTYNGTIHTKKVDPNPKFINDIKMSQHAVANGLRLRLRYIFIPANHLDSNDSAYDTPKSDGSYTMHEIHLDLPVISATIGGIEYTGYDAFFNDSEPINFGTATLNGDSVSLEFLASDFDNTDNPTCRREITAGGSAYVLFAQLTSFQFNDYGAYISDSNDISSFGVVPFLEFDALFEDDGVKTMAVGTYSEFTRLLINVDYNSGNFITTASIDVESITGGYYQGNFYIINNIMNRGESGSEYWYAADSPMHYPGMGRHGIIKGRHITYPASSGTNLFYIYTFLKPSDIWNSIIPYHKLDTLHDTNNATVPNKTYTPDYSTSIYSDNVPTEERKQDTLSNITEYLMDWQRPNNAISIDEFNIADMPIEPVPPPTPPADDERTSGSWRANSDLVNFGNANGFVTQYVITGNQLQNLGHYLWSGFWDDDFLDSIMVSFLENFSLYPADILKYFVSIRKYPLNLDNATYNLDWTSQIYIGRGKKGINLDTGTDTIGVLPNFAHIIRTEWKKIPANYHDFRDYEPCCRVVIFVPFCGEVELTPSQAIDSEVRLEYCIDFSNGAVECAVVIRPAEKPNDLYIAAVLTGSMGASVQLSASNLTQFLMNGTKAITGQVQSLIQDVGTAVTMAAGAMEAGEGTSIDKGKYLGGLASTTGAHVGDGLNSITGLVGTPVPKFGNNSGFSSFLVLTPNIQITYRWYEQPSNYGHAVGYACNKAVKIGDLTNKGFSVFRNVDLSGVPATQDELAAIEALLQSGVYL